MQNNTPAEEVWMQRALDLAGIGQGTVSPNPMVGCVIEYQGKILGEGWHQKYGEAHAEVNAVHSVEDKGLISESTVYVTLEPCTHYGKTPPCVDLLIRHRPRKVVIANTDPNPLVAGQGIKKLRKAGIEVVTGVKKKEGRELNRRFFTFFEKKRPYVILKWAETADGFIARKNYDSKWISNTLARKLVHQWRTEEDAIMVGTNTAHYDNPQLTARDWAGKNPVRVVLDRTLRLSPDLHLFDGQVKTLCYTLQREEEQGNVVWIKLKEGDFLESLMADLYQRKIQSILIEGGSHLLSTVLKKGLWDEARIFKSKTVFGEGIPAPLCQGVTWATQPLLDNHYFEYRREIER